MSDADSTRATVQQRRPLGIGKKGMCYQDPAAAFLVKLSKAALVDCVIDLMRGLDPESADNPVSEAAARERFSVVLQMRGDRVPK